MPDAGTISTDPHVFRYRWCGRDHGGEAMIRADVCRSCEEAVQDAYDLLEAAGIHARILNRR